MLGKMSSKSPFSSHIMDCSKSRGMPAKAASPKIPLLTPGPSLNKAPPSETQITKGP